LKLAQWEEEPDRKQLEKDVANFVGLHLFKPLKEIDLSRLLQHLLELATKNRLRITPDIFLMLKALSQLECIARQIDPEFDIIQTAVPFIRKAKLARLEPGRLVDNVFRLVGQSHEFLTDFPKDLLEISHALRRKKMSLTLVFQDLEKVLITHDQISNRISFAIIIAALIIGSALIVVSNMPPMLYGISLIGLVGFLFAGFMGGWLLVAIIKKGRL
jgi:ubiquinone biosynthesis protein